MGLLGNVTKRLKKAVNPVKGVKLALGDVRNVGEAGKQYIRATAQELKRRPAVGVARIALSFTGIGAAGLMAYDAKRLREKTADAKRKFRVIRKQALADGDTIQERLNSNAAPGARVIGGLYETIVPAPEIVVNRDTGAPQGAWTAGEPTIGEDLMSFLSPGAPGSVDAPTPDTRGAGGDAREGVKVQLGGMGKGIALLVVAGLVLAALAAKKGAS